MQRWRSFGFMKGPTAIFIATVKLAGDVSKAVVEGGVVDLDGLRDDKRRDDAH